MKETSWVMRQTIIEHYDGLTIMEALAQSHFWHTWVIATPDGGAQLERHCKKDAQGICLHDSYWFICDSHRTANAESIESSLYFIADEVQHEVLRTASLSENWTFYGVERD